MGAVGTAKGICRIGIEFVVNCFEIAFGYNHIRIENEHILALGTFHAIVAALSGSAVWLLIIVQVETVGILGAHVAACNSRTILYDNHLKVLY